MGIGLGLVNKINIPLHLLLLILAVVPILVNAGLKSLWPGLHWENELLHSAGETVGTIIAIFMAVLLFLKHKENPEGNSYLLALGFLSMGLLDGFHAISKPGDSFVFLHSIANVFGGFWFALACLPAPVKYLSKKNATSWVVISGSLLCGIWIYLLPETIPSMAHNGDFTTTAIAINSLSGIMFIFAAFRFLIDFYRVKTIETYLFACMFMLFGIAEITFYQSSIWGSGWWVWHSLRLVAYILVMLFIIRQYIKVVAMQKETEDRYRGVVEDTPVLVNCFDSEYKITFVNNALCDFVGKSSEELVGSSFLARIPETDQKFVKDNIAALNSEFPEQSHEHRAITSAGDICWQHWTNRGLFDAQGQILGYQSIGLDITERKKAEKELQNNRNLLNRIINQSPFATWISDKKGTIIKCNAALEKLLNITGEQLIGKYNVFEDEIAIEQGLIPKIRTVFENGNTANFSVEWDANELGYKDAKKVHIEGTMFPIHNEKGDLTNVVNHWIDTTKRNQAMKKLESKTSELTKEIAERIQTEEKLIESEEKHRTLFESMVQGVVYQDADGKIISANPAAENILGLTIDQMQGCVSMDPRWKAIHEDKSDFPGEKHPAMVSLRTGQPIHDVVMGVFHPDEERHRWIRINSIPKIRPGEKKPYQVYTTFTDITEHKKLEAQIQQSQKMESIGNLAGGIAHDFNNLLFPIIGMSEMLLEDLPKDSREYENVEEIFHAGRRAGNLVQQILAFSRQSEHKMAPVRVQNVLKEVLKLSHSTIPSNIEIHENIQQDCGLIRADSTQVHQVAMNLITNAYHAIEDKNGAIDIKLEKMTLQDNELPDTVLLPGQYVQLSVSDNGIGMSQNTISKIFEPYFTTKQLGKGTGLGLAVVYGIVKEHGGDIKVYSEIEKGTTFNIYLPLMEKAAETAVVQQSSKAVTGTESILLVDDEVSVAKLEGQMLSRLGYQVTAETSSRDALNTFKSNPNSFDLVISDMTMPNMTGDQLAKELLSIKADIPIIICTGFSERINKEQAEAIGVNGFLMKPVVKSDMAQMIRKVLDEVKKH